MKNVRSSNNVVWSDHDRKIALSEFRSPLGADTQPIESINLFPLFWIRSRINGALFRALIDFWLVNVVIEQYSQRDFDGGKLCMDDNGILIDVIRSFTFEKKKKLH